MHVTTQRNGFMGRRRAVDPPAVLTYETTVTNEVDDASSPISIAGVDIGPEAADRHVIVATVAFGAAVTSLTIGGVAATQHTTASGTRIWSADVPTGTTATIDAGFIGTMNRIAFIVWQATGLNSTTPIEANSSGINLNVESGGFAITATVDNGTAVTGYTLGWNGTDAEVERVDAAFSETANRYAAADVSTTETNTTRDWSYTAGGTPSTNLPACASWR